MYISYNVKLNFCKCHPISYQISISRHQTNTVFKTRFQPNNVISQTTSRYQISLDFISDSNPTIHHDSCHVISFFHQHLEVSHQTHLYISYYKKIIFIFIITDSIHHLIQKGSISISTGNEMVRSQAPNRQPSAQPSWSGHPTDSPIPVPAASIHQLHQMPVSTRAHIKFHLIAFPISEFLLPIAGNGDR